MSIEGEGIENREREEKGRRWRAGKAWRKS